MSFEVNSEKIDDFVKLFDKCFDENNKVRLCGREACQELLDLLDDPRYGNRETGVLNTNNIVRLYYAVVPPEKRRAGDSPFSTPDVFLPFEL